MTASLFTATDLSDYLHTDVSSEAAAVAERVVWGWLSNATGLSARPDTVTDDLFAWALELGAMVYDNPTSLAVRQVDDARMEATEERRNDILRAVSEAGDVSTGGAPKGSFPDPCPWPDPLNPFRGQVIYTAG